MPKKIEMKIGGKEIVIMLNPNPRRYCLYDHFFMRSNFIFGLFFLVTPKGILRGTIMQIIHYITYYINITLFPSIIIMSIGTRRRWTEKGNR